MIPRATQKNNKNKNDAVAHVVSILLFLQLLADLGSLAHAVAQIVELRAADNSRVRTTSILSMEGECSGKTFSTPTP